MTSSEDVTQYLHFLESDDPLLIAYTIDAQKVGDQWNEILLAFNANLQPREIALPAGQWSTYLINGVFSNDMVLGDQLALEPSTATILYRQE